MKIRIKNYFKKRCKYALSKYHIIRCAKKRFQHKKMYSIPRILFFYFLFPPCLSLLFRPMLSILSPVLVLVIHSSRSFILALSIPPGKPAIRASSPMETKNMEHLILFLSIFHSIPICIPICIPYLIVYVFLPKQKRSKFYKICFGIQ